MVGKNKREPKIKKGDNPLLALMGVAEMEQTTETNGKQSKDKVQQLCIHDWELANSSGSLFCQKCGADLIGHDTINRLNMLESDVGSLCALYAEQQALIERLVEDYLTHYERNEFGEVKTRCIVCGANDNETDSLIHEETCPIAEYLAIVSDMEIDGDGE